MRASTNKSDPGYRFDSWRVTVWLDGIKQKNCITADDTLGEIVRIQIGPDGRPLHENGEILTETVKGIVRIDVDERGT